jgi:hypothetical protein
MQTSGILITSGDTGTVTNTMLAGSIADSKLLQITTAGKVATNNNIVYIRNNSNAALSTVSAGMVQITSTSFCCFNWKCFYGYSFAAGGTISGTGEATFTTGAFDGTGNVSGAVTLLNSAVISKVLTGYASGPGVVAATDSILAAIQKINRNTLKWMQ